MVYMTLSKVAFTVWPVEPASRRIGLPALNLLLCMMMPSGGLAAQSASGEVASVRFEGNEFFSDAELQRLILTKPPSCPPILAVTTCALGLDWGRSRTTLSSSTLQLDTRGLILHYRANGFRRAEVSPTAVENGDGTVSVTFRIVEGAAYRIGSINFEGDSVPPGTGDRGRPPHRDGEIRCGACCSSSWTTRSGSGSGTPATRYADVFLNYDLPAGRRHRDRFLPRGARSADHLRADRGHRKPAPRGGGRFLSRLPISARAGCSVSRRCARASEAFTDSAS